MRKVLKLAKREYKAAVRTKGFIIGLVLFPVMMGGSGIAIALLKDRVDAENKAVAVIDRSGLLGPAIKAAADRRNAREILDEETGKPVKPAYHIELVIPDADEAAQQRFDLSERIREGELHAFLEIGPTVLRPGDEPEGARVAYYAENAAVDDLRGWLGRVVNGRLRELRLAESGLDESLVAAALDWRAVEPLGLVTRDMLTGEIVDAERSSEIQAFLVPIIMMMLMWMMLWIGAFPLMNAVMEEKNQRIAELMLGSVRPFEFMLGKLIGGIGVTLTAATIYIAGGAAAVSYYGYADFVPYEVLPWFFAYMLLMVLMVGAMLAAAGAACNDSKEAQSLIMPILIPVLIPMFVMMPVVQAPNSAFATGLSFFPTCTPLLMVLRMSTPVAVPGWQPWVGLVLVFLFTLLAVWVGGRIFRVGLLMQGQSPTLANLFRWALRP